jgi:phosphoenolpyruvate-protein phosphotransferase
MIRGIAASRGFAIGPAFQFRPVELSIEQRSVSDPEGEVRRLEQGISATTRELQTVLHRAQGETSQAQASIFEAHLLMLQDPELLQSIRQTITDRKLNAEFAVREATEQYAQTLDGMENEYLRARAADVRDVAQRLLRVLLSAGSANTPNLAEPSIIFAADLMPSDTILLDKRLVLGFCTSEGSETSHTAILARGLGIPAVVGGGAEVLSIPDRQRVILDGLAGTVVPAPTDDMIEEYKFKLRSLTASSQEAMARCHEPAITRDGHQVEVVANIGTEEAAKTALDQGAEGVGLLRTEFLYMERGSLPDEEEQYRAYSNILVAFGKLPVILRTSDIGGDKALPYLELPKELNPFLGIRGLRLALLHPEELLRPQLKAALRAGTGHTLRIMFPMVTGLSEIRQAQKALEDCRAELIDAGKPIAENLQVGIMVEVPSAAVMADMFAPEVDFFSVGTNDLTQYTLAADRTNTQLAHLASAFSPAVLRLIQNVIVQAHKHGKWAGVCGELAGEPLAIPILLGLGLDEFSMNPQAIPLAKQVIRSLTIPRCRELAESVLCLESAEEVKAFVQEKMPEISALS